MRERKEILEDYDQTVKDAILEVLLDSRGLLLNIRDLLNGKPNIQ